MKLYLLLFICGLEIISCKSIEKKSDETRSDKPNIIVILSDDMGYSDIGCYGGEIQTPNLDKLASNGVRFTQFYNSARCCPTRASLLTGLYPHQTGVGKMLNDQGEDGYRGDLNNNCVTMAQVLKPAGYATYCIGKWHVTPHPKINEEYSTHNWPLQRGFDNFYGIITGAVSFWDPATLTRQNKMITIKNDPEYQPNEPYHFTDAISDNTVKYIEEADDSKPFFMYVAYTAAHWPMHARQRDIKKYDGVYDKGYDAIRQARYKKMQELGLINANAKLSPTVGNWDKVKDKEFEVELMKTYAAMVDQMDQGIGRIVKALKDKGQLDNTLIVFMQDNGGCAEAIPWLDNGCHGPRSKLAKVKPIHDDSMHYEFLAPAQTRDGRQVMFSGTMPGPDDTYFSYGKGWANVSNTPFREYKHWVHEGGISTPLIMHWPKGIKGKNELKKAPGHIVDIMATCVDVSGAKYPENYKNSSIKPMEGKSLMPIIKGDSMEREYIIWEHGGNRALRMGNWKIVAKGGKGKWELYNLEVDRSELNNLADVFPDRLKRMTDKFEVEAYRTNIFPWPSKKK